MITAEEARALTEEHLPKLQKIQLIQLGHEIRKAARAGRKQLHVSVDYWHVCKEPLRQLGYTIERSVLNNEMRIYW